jgi:hypothetical protein
MGNPANAKHNKKTYEIKVETLVDFMKMPWFRFKYLHQVFQLTKMNGIYILDDSLHQQERTTILDQLNEAFPPKNIFQDDFSKDLLYNYIQHANIAQSNKSTDENGINSRVINNSQVTPQLLMKPVIQRLDEGARYDIRINLPPNGGIEMLRSQLQQIINKITEIDNSVAFLPWFSSDSEDKMPFNVVPESLWEINRYFPRIKHNAVGSTYGEFQMLHSKSFAEIIDQMTPWLFEEKHAIYFQTLQCKLTTKLGWFLWSFRNIDTAALQQELYNLYNIQVQLRYQNITLGKSKEGETVHALHIVVNKDQSEKISMMLQQIYSFEVTQFPLGIIMRFIPHISKVSITREPTLSKWRDNQRLFLESIQDPSRPMMTRTWEIQDLSEEFTFQPSIKKLLMNVKSIEFPTEYLFLSVDTSFFRRKEVNFTFLPRHENEARGFVTNIIPFI